MTMPHYMNCSHSPDGWCLSCVSNEYETTSRVLEAAQELINSIDTSDKLLRYGDRSLEEYMAIESLRKALRKEKSAEHNYVKLGNGAIVTREEYDSMPVNELYHWSQECLNKSPELA